jgi:hypothetical protein
LVVGQYLRMRSRYASIEMLGTWRAWNERRDEGWCSDVFDAEKRCMWSSDGRNERDGAVAGEAEMEVPVPFGRLGESDADADACTCSVEGKSAVVGLGRGLRDADDARECAVDVPVLVLRDLDPAPGEAASLPPWCPFVVPLPFGVSPPLDCPDACASPSSSSYSSSSGRI